ncbi:LuxR C-terminal-related transcriptional regulator [Hymenobacter sp. B81]|uniref:LuxR C-terminal-related transcriptional regulator n=1 Tax=Hymenobacter sp. B81 TaxID=3344878 RepID=UPI0037DDD743
MVSESAVQASINEIAAIADHYPGVLIILDQQASRVRYMSARGLQRLGTTVAELTALGAAYYERYFNPEEAQEYVPKVLALLDGQDPAMCATFFQQVRTGPQGTFEWYLSTAQVLLRDADGRPELIICFSCPISPDSHITAKVQRLVEENIFLRRHHATFGLLTQREREVLRLLALGRTAPDIARELFIAPQTVETHRRNLRQKLGAESLFELSQYARAFNLI